MHPPLQVSAHGTGAAIPPVDEQVVALKLVTPALGTIELSKVGVMAVGRQVVVFLGGAAPLGSQDAADVRTGAKPSFPLNRQRLPAAAAAHRCPPGAVPRPGAV